MGCSSPPTSALSSTSSTPPVESSTRSLPSLISNTWPPTLMLPATSKVMISPSMTLHCRGRSSSHHSRTRWTGFGDSCIWRWCSSVTPHEECILMMNWWYTIGTGSSRLRDLEATKINVTGSPLRPGIPSTPSLRLHLPWQCVFMPWMFQAESIAILLKCHEPYTIESSSASGEVILKNTLPYTPVYTMYIARIMSDDFLQIWRSTADTSVEDSLETCIDIRKVGFHKHHAVDVDTLNDDTLFIGHKLTRCLSTEASYSVLRLNHVYFTDDDE